MNNQSIHDYIARLQWCLIELKQQGGVDDGQLLDEHSSLLEDVEQSVLSLTRRSRQLIKRMKQYKDAKDEEVKDGTDS